MKRFIGFGSIDQFRTVIKDIQWLSQYQGKDDQDNIIMNRNAKLPKIKVLGTEKIHGTNAAVCFSNIDGFWCQSRRNIINIEKDNASCAFHVYKKEEQWMDIINTLAKEYSIDCDKFIISIYFEWAGGNIQKKSALTSLDKRAMIFQYFKVSPIEQKLDKDDQELNFVWLETNKIHNPKANIWNIMNYPKVEMEINFNEPSMSQNKMIEMVNNLEKDSLVGKAFGIDGNIGEGYVFTFEYKGLHRFKVKGEEHAKDSGKIKTLSPVDEEFENKKRTFVNEHAIKEFRLEQAWQEVFGIENEKLEPSMKSIGDFLRFVFKDIIKEESDVMEIMGLEPKNINGMISKVAKVWFIDKLEKDS